jgi:hypothetical protein
MYVLEIRSCAGDGVHVLVYHVVYIRMVNELSHVYKTLDAYNYYDYCYYYYYYHYHYHYRYRYCYYYYYYYLLLLFVCV